MFFVVPGRHPGLLFQVFPVTVPRAYRSLLPFDPNCAVTGNLVFILGSLKEATLQGRKGEKTKVKQCSVRGGKRLFKDIPRERKQRRVDERHPRCSESSKRCGQATCTP